MVFCYLPDFEAGKELHHFGGFQYLLVWTFVRTKCQDLWLVLHDNIIYCMPLFNAVQE